MGRGWRGRALRDRCRAGGCRDADPSISRAQGGHGRCWAVDPRAARAVGRGPARRVARPIWVVDQGLIKLLLAILGLCAATIAAGAELPGLAAEARSILGADQGVYVEGADGTVLLAQAAAKAVHPASVSKVPTTLALLRK